MKRSVVIAVVLASVATAHAHALDIAYLRVEPPASASAPAKVILDLDIGAVALLLDIEPSTVTAELVTARANDLVAISIGKQPPTTPTGACTLGAVTTEHVPPSVRISTTITCPAGARSWRFPFVTDARIPASFQLLVKDVASDRLTVIERATPVVDLGDATPARPVTPTSAATTERPLRTYIAGGVIGVLTLAAIGFFASRRKRS